MRICENCYSIAENNITCSITGMPLCLTCYEKEEKSRIILRRIRLEYQSLQLYPEVKEHYRFNPSLFKEMRRTLRAMRSGFYNVMIGGISFDLSRWSDQELRNYIAVVMRTL